MFSKLASWWSRRAERNQLEDLIHHCYKRMRRDSDLISSISRDRFITEIQKAQNSLSANEKNLEKPAEALVEAYTKTFTPQDSPSWRENGEVILVALVVAMAVRAFFLQPFKIPTGSMQPTLNGITVRAATPQENSWWYKVIALPLFGENVINYKAVTPGKFHDLKEVSFPPFHFGGSRGFFNLLPTTGVEFFIGTTRYTFPRERSSFQRDILGEMGGRSFLDMEHIFQPGEPVINCIVQTGDQLFVDRMSYYFHKPQRGDVFVFETNDLPVQNPGDFYIKRLAGIPGDTLRLASPDLFSNGKKPDHPGFQRVMSMKDGYHGYANGLMSQKHLSTPSATYTLKPRQYFALGDNSYNSSDSRMWGPVPYKNIVGKGFFVYWPFTKHFGRVE